MDSEFIGRQSELALVDNIWESSKAALLILYGRRRVGKTRLLIHWLQQHNGQGASCRQYPFHLSSPLSLGHSGTARMG